MNPSVDRLLTRARVEMESGRLWRAKEILRGAISSTTYATEPVVLETYGKLLDALGDRYEAGKYLFLSGSRAPEYVAAIEIYIGRTRKLPVNALMAQFPSALHHQGIGHLPDAVRQYLVERGLPQSEAERREPNPAAFTLAGPQVITGWKAKVIGAGLLVFLVLIVMSILVGFVTMVSWLFGV